MHVALRVAYDGTGYQGLARQPGKDTIEGRLMEALQHEGFVEGSLRCGSRTDAGVSAAENVLKAELDRPHLKGLVPALARHLPDDVWVTAAAPIDEDWNVQHAASRTYEYWAPDDGEDPARLAEACGAFVGEHDFTAFARIEDRKAVRPLHAMSVDRADGFWRFEITAPGFLWNQVRRMVSACLAVGSGAASVQDIETALATGIVHGSFSVAPADGLLLTAVTYAPGLPWSADAGSVPVARWQRAVQAQQVRRRVLWGISGSAAGLR